MTNVNRFGTTLVQGTIALIFLVMMAIRVLFEEALGLLLLSVVLGGLVGGVILLILKFFKKPLKPLIVTFWCASVFQIAIVGFVEWSLMPRYFDRQQVMDDLDHAQEIMEDIHPDLYATTSKEKYDAAIDKIKGAIPAKVSEVECTKIFALAIAHIKDGHTNMELKNHSKRGAILFRKGPPYAFRIIDNRLYIKKSYYARNPIPVGSEILEINGKQVAQCIAEVEKYESFETTAFRNAILAPPLVWGLWNDFQKFEYTYRTPDNQVITAGSRGGLIANLSLIKDFLGLKNTFKIVDGNIGYLEIETFSGDDDFNALLLTSFSKIRATEVSNLIIDIRNCEGGSTGLSENLMQYIAHRDFRSFELSLLKISKDLTTRYKVDTEKYKIGSLVDEEYELTPLEENPLRFDGQVFVLTSGACFSTALDFPAMVRCFDAGVLIGSETGGRTESFGSPQGMVTMPETGIAFKVSRKQFVNPCPTEEKTGLIPDYIVENTILDDINNFDRVLDFTLSLINETSK